MSESLTSEVGRGVGVQSTPDHQASVSGQEQGPVGGSVSSRTRKQMTETNALTAGQRGMAQKPKKAKSRKSRGVKTSGSGGTKPGSVPSTGKGRAAVRLFPAPLPKPEDTRLPADAAESSDTEDESVGSAYLLSHSPRDSKSDQFAFSLVTPPQEPLIPGGITTTVTDKTVLTRDSSPVPDSARLSSSTPVKQEGTAAQTLQVSAEVYVVTEPEREAADVSKNPLQVLTRMSLGTQVSSELP